MSMSGGWMFNFEGFDIERYNSILSNGLSHGLGSRESGKMCIEAAVCYALGLKHGDDPKCVSAAVRGFKIRLNDSGWSSPAARAEGLRELGIAQLGSLGRVDDRKFSLKLAEKTIRRIIPKMFREVFPRNEKMEAVALRCEIEGTGESASAAADAAHCVTIAPSPASHASGSVAAAAANAVYCAAHAVYCASSTADNASVSNAVRAAAYAASYAASYTVPFADVVRTSYAAPCAGDGYLKLSAQIALETLREMQAPGVEYLDGLKAKGLI